MLATVCVAGSIGLGAGIFAAASADSFPALRSRLSRWGCGVLVGSVAVLGFAIAMI